MCRDRPVQRERLRRRMLGALLAERRVLPAAYRCGHPELAVLAEHRVVVVDARFPDPLVAPVRRRLRRIEPGGVARAQVERHLRVTYRRLERRGDVLDGVQDRDEIGAVLGRPVERAVRVHGREATVAGDEIVQVVLLGHPVAEGDDDVPLHALGPGRLGERQLALGDAFGPVAEVGERRVAQVRELAEHHLAGLPRLDAAAPRLGGGGEGAERRRNRARGGLAELMAADAARVLHRADPVGLRDAGRDASRSAKLARRRDLQHRVPVDRGVVVRGGGLVGCDHRGDVQTLPRLRGRLGAVNQAIAPCPHLVACRRQIRHDEAAAVVGHDALDVADGQVPRFGNHPDAGLRSLGAGDHAADVVVVDGDVDGR